MLLLNDQIDAFILNLLAKKPKRLTVTTIALYAGIAVDGSDTSDWSDSAASVRKLVDAMQPLPDVRVIVGMRPYRSCKHSYHCQACGGEYVKQFVRLSQHAEHFAPIDWRICEDQFAKLMRFEFNKMSLIVMGRNLTDPQYDDINVVIDSRDPDFAKANAVIEQIVHKSLPIDDETFTNLCTKYNLNPNTLV
jgi:hypothetical protein